MIHRGQRCISGNILDEIDFSQDIATALYITHIYDILHRERKTERK